MQTAHFLAFIPLFICLTLSLIFLRSGVVHIILIAYSLLLGFGAIVNQWEIFIWPITIGTAIIGIFLLWSAAVNGDWF